MTGQDRKQLLSLPDTFRILATLRSARLTVRPRRLCRWGKIYGGVRARAAPPECGRALDGVSDLARRRDPARVRGPLIAAPGGVAEGATIPLTKQYKFTIFRDSFLNFWARGVIDSTRSHTSQRAGRPVIVGV